MYRDVTQFMKMLTYKPIWVQRSSVCREIISVLFDLCRLGFIYDKKVKIQNLQPLKIQKTSYWYLYSTYQLNLRNIT